MLINHTDNFSIIIIILHFALIIQIIQIIFIVFRIWME
jgi:hypothetical protein